MTSFRPINAVEMTRILRQGADRCVYCQRKDYTLDNPMVQVAPPVSGPPMVAHAKCDEPVQAWRKSRM